MSKKPPKPRYREPVPVVEVVGLERDEKTGEIVERGRPVSPEESGVERDPGLFTVDRFQDEHYPSSIIIQSRRPKKEHSSPSVDRLADILGVGCGEIYFAYEVALEDLENHEEHSGGRDPVSKEDCPWCKDAREVVRLVDLAVNNIEASLKTGNVRNAALAGLSLFGAGVHAGRLEAWPREAKVTHRLNIEATKNKGGQESAKLVVRTVKAYLEKRSGMPWAEYLKRHCETGAEYDEHLQVYDKQWIEYLAIHPDAGRAEYDEYLVARGALWQEYLKAQCHATRQDVYDHAFPSTNAEGGHTNPGTICKYADKWLPPAVRGPKRRK